MSGTPNVSSIPDSWLRLREERSETRFIRAGGKNGGDTYHLRGCSRAGERWIPWSWPDTCKMRPEELLVEAPWLKPCAYCLPELRHEWKYEREPEYA